MVINLVWLVMKGGSFCQILEARPLQPASSTPYPGGFKCFTCEEAADNYECNRWAPDVYCPQEAKYCYTHHKLDWVGNTVSVTKRCASLDDCLSTGCTDTDHEGIRRSTGGLNKTEDNETDQGVPQSSETSAKTVK
ncbi:ly6/PLAUR domain-containing protein 6 [Tachysurus ichikawai]